MYLNELQDKSVVLFGFGVEGQATYQFLRGKFPTKVIALADARPYEKLGLSPELDRQIKADSKVELLLGDQCPKSLQNYQAIIKTPGIAPSHPMLAGVESHQLTSHLEIFFKLFDRQRIVGITGTKGKSTTTSLIYQIVKEAGCDVYIGGNIGEPPLLKLAQVTDQTIFVLELSSYQLEQLTQSPHIAVLLNIVPEHLDYHGGFEPYAAAKEHIAKFQQSDDFLVYNQDYHLPTAIAERNAAQGVPFSVQTKTSFGAYLVDDRLMFADDKGVREVLSVADIPLIGAFNRQNVLAAIAATSLLGIDPAAIRMAVRNFQPLPHRLEYVGEYQGIKFYNDSISTVPECTLSALEALGTQVQTLILGGYDRHIDYTDFAAHIVETHVENFIFFSPTGQRMWQAFNDTGELFDQQAFFVESMAEAVQLAYEHTSAGHICLLSPASPSYSNFRDYRERGDKFKQYIKEGKEG